MIDAFVQHDDDRPIRGFHLIFEGGVHPASIPLPDGGMIIYIQASMAAEMKVLDWVELPRGMHPAYTPMYVAKVIGKVDGVEELAGMVAVVVIPTVPG